MRKGQLQTLEPILIIIFLAIIAGIGMLFWIGFVESDAKDSAAAYESREALALLQRITTLPEFSCALSETRGTYCIDLEKAKVFQSMMADERLALQYTPILGFSNITLEIVDFSGANQKLVLNSRLNSERYQIMRTYFTVHDPVEDTRGFGVLTIVREAG